MRNITHNQNIHHIGEIAQIIRIARRRAKLTQEALGKRVGISRRTVSDLESGNAAHISVTTLLGIFKQLNLEFRISAGPEIGILPDNYREQKTRIQQEYLAQGKEEAKLGIAGNATIGVMKVPEL